MKILNLVQLLAVSAFVLSPLAHANEGGKKECWFKKDDKECTKCKVVIITRGIGTDAPPGLCKPIELFVDCDNGFELKDEKAAQIKKEDSVLNVGSRREKVAVVQIVGDDNRGPSEENEAILTISSEQGAQRIDGRCRSSD